MSSLIDRIFGRDDEFEPQTRSHDTTTEENLCFSIFEISVEFASGKERTYSANDYTRNKNSIILLDREPKLIKMTHARQELKTPPTPKRNVPYLKYTKENERIISYANVNDIEIEEIGEVKASVTDIPITVTEAKWEPDGEWSEHYYEVYDGFDPDEYEIEIEKDFRDE
jgi:hypothetical protein